MGSKAQPTPNLQRGHPSAITQFNTQKAAQSGGREVWSICGDNVACIPNPRGSSFALTGDQERADDLAEKAMIEFYANRLAGQPRSASNIRILSIIHDRYFKEDDESRENIRTIGANGAEDVGKIIVPQ